MSARPTTPAAQLAHALARRETDLVVDVGANTGQYAARLFDHGYAGRVVSFEPLTDCWSALAERAAERPGQWHVAPRMALGDRAGQITINVSAERDMSSVLEMAPEFLASSPTSAFVGRETAPVERLDTVFDRYADGAARVLLKIDTQGYEIPVLDGTGGVIDRIDGVQVEMSLVPLYRGEATFEQLYRRVTDLGFAPFLFLPGYYSRHMGRMLQVDGVFFRE